MKLGVHIGYWGMGLTSEDQLTIVQEAERLGYDSVWAAEAYGSDAATVLAWLAAGTETIKLGSAIFQMPARSPAMTAMTAATIDELSGGRMRLGIGSSGPQVAEGWHGQRFAKQLQRTREYVEVVRMALARERVFSPEHVGEFRKLLQEGADRAGRSLDDFDIAPNVTAYVSDDRELARNLMRPVLALYIGGMGSRKQNFYNNLVQRYGFEQAAGEIQDLYLEGKKAEAGDAIPDELIDMVSLCGPRDFVRERIAAFRDAGVGTLAVTPMAFSVEDRIAQLRAVAELAA
jgi:alkanesulfonate monooxygenase SsuD/methylene tetrahydromethanopterin reductase-like flavin-dependent oxidoreductase (luciferase family)